MPSPSGCAIWWRACKYRSAWWRLSPSRASPSSSTRSTRTVPRLSGEFDKKLIFFYYNPSHNFHLRANGKWKFHSFYCCCSRLSWNVCMSFFPPPPRHSMFRSQLKIHLCKTAELRVVDSWGSARAAARFIIQQIFSDAKELFFCSLPELPCFYSWYSFHFPSAGCFFRRVTLWLELWCAWLRSIVMSSPVWASGGGGDYNASSVGRFFLSFHYYRNHVPLHNWRDLSLIMSLLFRSFDCDCCCYRPQREWNNSSNSQPNIKNQSVIADDIHR